MARLLRQLWSAPWHFGTGVQVSQEAAVGSQLCATALTQEEYVGFVMMPHMFHQFLHVGEGTAAADTGAQ